MKRREKAGKAAVKNVFSHLLENVSMDDGGMVCDVRRRVPFSLLGFRQTLITKIIERQFKFSSPSVLSAVAEQFDHV